MSGLDFSQVEGAHLPTGTRIEVFKRGVLNVKWYFRVVAPNNEIVAQSQGYKSKVNALKTIDTYFPAFEVVHRDRDV